ncbi:MAG TPA: SDR family oxidoreductase [Planctomycetota bacterium]|nr:SDR family oxidoreductase [Planctomycetota bacterium]
MTAKKSGAKKCCDAPAATASACDYLCNMFSLVGKKAVVTGGGGVLGTDMACALARAGAQVVLWDVREDALAASAARIKKDCGCTEGIEYRKVDLMNEAEMVAAIDAAGDFQILLNACGGNKGKAPLVEQDMETFRFVMKLNVEAGCFLPMKVVGKRWIEKKTPGCIINIASMSSYVPLSGVWAYDAAKAAVKNLTEGAAKEFAPYGIRVNAIAPGFFIGEQNRRLLTNEDGSLTDRGKAVIAHTPFGRFGEANELMGAVLYLASGQAAGFVTGITVPVDGGYLVQNI